METRKNPSKTKVELSVNQVSGLTLPVDASKAEASTGLAKEIAGRLKAARAHLGLKQDALASQSGVSYSIYQKYEMGRSAPGGEAIAGFIGVGINANWLLTGEGPMRLDELQPKPQPMKINTEALAAILDGAMRGLKGASTLEVAEFAVKMYVDALQQGLITPDGIGSGNQGNAA